VWLTVKRYRHAAALALLAFGQTSCSGSSDSWYLLLPPSSENGKTVDTNAPLSHWDQNSRFDSAPACENGLSTLRSLYRNAQRIAAGPRIPSTHRRHKW